MVAALKNVEDIIANYSGNARKVLDYSQITKRAVQASKTANATAALWDSLKELVAVDEFERIGNFKEVMNWNDYVAFLHAWASTAEWDCSFKRITEVGNIVFLELEERSTVGEHQNVVNSVSVYEFNADGKIRHIDVYLQMALPAADMLASYDGIAISG